MRIRPIFSAGFSIYLTSVVSVALGDGPANCTFDAGDLANWVSVGPVSVEFIEGDPRVVMDEDELAVDGTNLHQVFEIPPALLALSFTFASFVDGAQPEEVFPPDAFVASLFDPATEQPLLSNPMERISLRSSSTP